MFNRLYYIGKSRGQNSVKGRLNDHCSDRVDWWEIGVAFFNDGRDGFTGDDVDTIEHFVTKLYQGDSRVISELDYTSDGGSDIARGALPFIQSVLNFFDLQPDANDVNRGQNAGGVSTQTESINGPGSIASAKSNSTDVVIDVRNLKSDNHQYLNFSEIHIGDKVLSIPNGKAQNVMQVFLDWIAKNLGGEALSRACVHVSAISTDPNQPAENYREMNVNGTHLWFRGSSASAIIKYIADIASDSSIALPKQIEIIAREKPHIKKR